MLHVYRALLRLYPREYRDNFAPEMTAVFERMAGEHRSADALARLRFAAREIAGVIVGAAEAWVRSLSGRRLCSAARRDAQSETAAAEARIRTLVNRIEHAIATHDFETARSCSREELRERERLREARDRSAG
jgi:hypothetical protein